MDRYRQVRKQFVVDAINEMFKICDSDLRYEDAVEASKSNEAWYSQQIWATAQHQQWKKWFLREIVKRKISLSSHNAEYEFQMFDLAFGPKLKVE